MSDAPSAADLKALAASLPPSERLQGAEVADVLSGLVAVVSHGKDILKAAADGSNGIAQFLHDKAVSHAEEHGNPVPERGQTNEPATVGPPAPAAAPAIDYDKLAAAIVAAQSGQQAAPADAEVTADAAGAESQAGVQGEQSNAASEGDILA